MEREQFYEEMKKALMELKPRTVLRGDEESSYGAQTGRDGGHFH